MRLRPNAPAITDYLIYLSSSIINYYLQVIFMSNLFLHPETYFKAIDYGRTLWTSMNCNLGINIRPHVSYRIVDTYEIETRNPSS